MKFLTLIAALFAASSAMATTTVVGGCEVVQAENGNYFYKVDPTCQIDRTGQGNRGDGKPWFLQ